MKELQVLRFPRVLLEHVTHSGKKQVEVDIESSSISTDLQWVVDSSSGYLFSCL